MLFNYHTHTTRCNHASGTDRAYVENAIKAGIKTLGFSDHAPFYKGFPTPHTYRMKAEEIQEYANSIRNLQKEYQKDIRILLGFELEYYPKCHKKEMEFLRSVSPDYIILGQHFIGEEKDGFYSGYLSGDRLLSKYVDQALEGLETGDFLYLAHPDLPGCSFSDKAIDVHYRRLCEGAKRLRIPLEINLLGIRDNRQYPDVRFLKIAGEVGNSFILGQDAHDVNCFLNTKAEEKALAWVKELNLHLITKELI